MRTDPLIVKLRRHFKAARRTAGGEEEEQRGGRRPSRRSRLSCAKPDARVEEEEEEEESPSNDSRCGLERRTPFSKSKDPRETKAVSRRRTGLDAEEAAEAIVAAANRRQKWR